MSLTNVLDFRLDLIAFLLVCLGATTGVQLWLRRSYGGRLTRLAWAGLLALLAAGTTFSDSSGDRERARLREMLDGIAPTYAAELQRLGHEKINLHTAADNPLYLSMIDAERRWLACNSQVSDIYTLGRREDGAVVALVDSETDFDHDNLYLTEHESRTPIGQIHEYVPEHLRRAFAGEATFDDVPASDRWGTRVSAFIPLRDKAGKTYAVLGVDYNAQSWNGDILQARAATLGIVGIVAAILIACASTLTVMRAELERRGVTETALRESEARLRTLAMHDKLTGLPNRSLFHERLAQSLARSQRHPGHKFAVLFLDFDRFKVVNDSLGHEIGDLLLQGIAERVGHSLRPNDSFARPAGGGEDTAARVGGDEFLVLLDGIRTGADAEIVAERLQLAVSTPFLIKGHEVQSTVSIGITTSEGNYTRAEDVVRDADTAMYRAKASGKARHVVFNPQMHEQAVARLTAENELRRAIDRRELILEYQPIVALENGQVLGFEALTRWDHPTRGRVAPQDFIPLAEECGLITSLGHWVLDEACRQLADWRERFPARRGLTMSVNVSRKQLESDGLVKQITEAIREHHVLPNQLKLEITESMLMHDAETAVNFLKQFRSLGVQLHIDDFGTGYSSLSCLHRFPIDGLKIDRAFIANASEHRDYAAVVNAIVMLARNLNMALVAEGVETAEQVALLQSLGCDQAQGYYFAKPLTVADAEAFMEERGIAIAAA